MKPAFPLLLRRFFGLGVRHVLSPFSVVGRGGGVYRPLPVIRPDSARCRSYRRGARG